MYQVTAQANPSQLGTTITYAGNGGLAGQGHTRRLEQTMKRFDHLLEVAATIASTAEQVAIEYAGHDVPESKPGVAVPPPSSLIGNLESVAEQFEARLERIRVAVVRLQTL